MMLSEGAWNGRGDCAVDATAAVIFNYFSFNFMVPSLIHS